MGRADPSGKGNPVGSGQPSTRLLSPAVGAMSTSKGPSILLASLVNKRDNFRAGKIKATCQTGVQSLVTDKY